MDSIIKYDEKNGIICAAYDDILCNVIEVDVTDQARQAVFRYLMAHGLSLNEHCTPTFEPVKHGKWLEIGQQYIQDWQMMNKCSACGKSVTNTRYGDRVVYFKFCPHCGATMENE